MTPIKFFEYFFTPTTWSLGIIIDFDFKRIWLGIGPLNFSINWSAPW